MTSGYLRPRRGSASIPRCPRHPLVARPSARARPGRDAGFAPLQGRRRAPARRPIPRRRSRMRSRSLVALAIAVTVVPALAQAAESAAEDPGETPVSQDLRESVREVGNRARAHSTRLGLRPATLPAPAATISAMRRQQRRLREVVAFLSGREEIALPVDRRPAPRALPRGRDLETRVAYEHRRATRLALRLGLEQPGPLAPEAGPADRRNELARWTAIARWLSARA